MRTAEDNTLLISKMGRCAVSGYAYYCLSVENVADKNEALVDIYLALLDGYIIEHPLLLHRICITKRLFAPRIFRHRNPDIYQVFCKSRNTKNYFFSRQKEEYAVNRILHLIDYPDERKLLKAYLENSQTWDHTLWETCSVNGYPAGLPLREISHRKPVIQIDTDNAAEDGINFCMIQINSDLYSEEQLVWRIRKVLKNYSKRLEIKV